MPRILSPALQTLLASDWLESHSFLRLTLADGQLFRWATQADRVDGFDHTGDLLSVGPFKFSNGGAADRVEATLQNVTLTWGLSLLAASDALTGARAEAGRYWRKPDDEAAALSRVLLKGLVVGAEMDENAVRLQIVSDAYTGEHIAGQRLITRACQFKYKGIACGATSTESDCNKLYDDPGGCAGRNNQHRNGGFIFDTSKSSLVVTINTGGGVNVGGGIGGGGEIQGDDWGRDPYVFGGGQYGY